MNTMRVSAVLIAIVILLIWRLARVRNAIFINGTVVDYRRVKGDERNDMCPIVEYVDRKDNKVLYEANVGSHLDAGILGIKFR